MSLVSAACAERASSVMGRWITGVGGRVSPGGAGMVLGGWRTSLVVVTSTNGSSGLMG